MEKIIRVLTRMARWEHFGLLVIVLGSVILHLAIITQPDQPVFDETHYITDARRILSGAGSERVEHPPIGKLGVAAGIRVFGDNPWGWRMPSLILGTTELILFYGICRRLGAKNRVTYIATFLFAFENFTFIHAGLAMLDIYVAFFMMLAFWLYLKGLSVKNRLFNVWWLFMAIAIALSALSKLSGVFTAIPIGLHWLFSGYKRPAISPPAPAIMTPVAAAGSEPQSVPMTEATSVEPGMMAATVVENGSEQNVAAPAIEPAETALGEAAQTPGLAANVTETVITTRKRWGIITRYVYSLPFVLYGILTAAFFLGLLMVGDYIIWHKWMEPIGQLKSMSSLMESIKFSGYTAPVPSRPWEWLLSPTDTFKLYQWLFKPGGVDTVVLAYSYTPHVTGMASPSVWLIGLAVIPYVIWRAFKRDNIALFALLWLIGIWAAWIPVSLITDRVTFAFYYLPSIGAMCLGGGMILNSLLEKAEVSLRRVRKNMLQTIVALFLMLHLVSFCVLSPVKLPISIAASLLILTFGFDYLGYSWRFLIKALVAIGGWVLIMRFVLVAPLLTWFNGGPLDYAGYAESGAFWLWTVLASAAIVMVLFVITDLVLKWLVPQRTPTAPATPPGEPVVTSKVPELTAGPSPDEYPLVNPGDGTPPIPLGP